MRTEHLLRGQLNGDLQKRPMAILEVWIRKKVVLKNANRKKGMS